MAYCYWVVSLMAYFSLVLFGVDAMSDELPPPQNLSLSWSPDLFLVTAQWSEPAGLEADCKVNYELGVYSEICPRMAASEWQVNDLNFMWKTDENAVCVSITTNPVNCGHKKPSRSLHKSLSRPPGLVKNFTCVYYSHMKMNCTWSIISSASDLQLFYRQNGESLKPCVSYIEDGLVRTGCHLYGEEFVNGELFFLINGTHKGIPRQSNFIRDINKLVKIPPLQLNITALDGKSLYIQSSPPGFKLSCWVYQFYYRACNEEEKLVNTTDYWFRLEYNDACRYTFRVKAIYKHCGEGGSELSEPVYYGQNSDINWPLKMAMVVTPIVVTCCFIAALVLCQRHKDYLFPKIPEPSLYFKDVLNSNKDKALEVGKLYIPSEDVVDKSIILVPECTVLRLEP